MTELSLLRFAQLAAEKLGVDVDDVNPYDSLHLDWGLDHVRLFELVLLCEALAQRAGDGRCGQPLTPADA